MGALSASKITLGLVVWALLSGSLVAADGFFEEGGPGGAPERVGTEPSRVGDAGLYKTALVIVDIHGKGEWIDMEARYAFERTLDRFVLDRNGDPTWARSFVAEWETEPFEADLKNHFQVPQAPQGPVIPGLPGGPSGPGTPTIDCSGYPSGSAAWEDCWDNYGDAWDAWGDDWEEWADDMAWAEWDADWLAWAEEWEGYDDEWIFFGAPVHRVQETPWQVSHHDAQSTGFAATFRPSETTPPAALAPALAGLADPTWTEAMPIDGPCGFRHDLQGTGVPIWNVIEVHGACPPPIALDFGASELLSGPLRMKVSGTDRVGERDTTVYALESDSDRLRLWFANDVAYPVRILDRLPDVVPAEVQALAGDAKQPTLYVMHELIEYAAGSGPTLHHDPSHPAIAPAVADRTAWGPDDTGVPLHWPLSRAFDSAVTDTLSDWYKAHPDAQIVQASATVRERAATQPNTEPERWETWTFTLTDGTSARVVTSTLHGRTQTGILGGEARTWREHSLETKATATDSGDLPRPNRLPATMPSATSQLHRFQVATGHAAAGYSFDLSTGAFWVTDGNGASAETLLVGADGRPLFAVHGDASDPAPQFQDETWTPYANDPWNRHAATKGVWQWPEPKTIGALAGAAAGVTLLSFVVAALKAGSGVGLFSRIAKADLLDHPVRNDIMAAVSSDPGIHFQELVRRLGKGRGTMEHHVRKLVGSDLLVERSDKGFTCYFPKGQIDRRVMAAAPLLKSDGARMVLQAVTAVPGAVAKDLAAQLGMAPSTINYHLRKLTEAGLIDGVRQGRFLALHTTETGRLALGTFAPAAT